jgi:large subunit ribosomal protein L22
VESTAKTTIRQSSKKVRFVLDEIRNSNINDALAKLSFMNKKAAKNIHQTITSAINNMQQLETDFDEANLFIKKAYVDQGPTMKRFRPAAMGRAVRILKRTSNLTIVISDEKK